VETGTLNFEIGGHGRGRGIIRVYADRCIAGAAVDLAFGGRRNGPHAEG
jgi:hypothetical protein